MSTSDFWLIIVFRFARASVRLESYICALEALEQNPAIQPLRILKTESRQDRPRIESAIKLLAQAAKLLSY